MKHNLKVTVILVTFFFLAQLVGLGILFQDMKVVQAVKDTGEVVTEVSHPETALGERPNVKNQDALLMVLIAILIGTGFILLIAKFGVVKLWKIFFFLAVFFSITIALGTFLHFLAALIIAFLLAFFKLLKPNIAIHNITEVLIYAGIAVLFVPLFDPLWILILLLIISAYDMFAVWKSKHMVKLAEFQIESRAFSGLFISPSRSKFKKSDNTKSRDAVAIIGGGDIAFPLLFAGVVLETLVLRFPPLTAFLYSLLVPVFVTIALIGLMVYGKKGHYYPAMPFLTAGALVGYGLILVL